MASVSESHPIHLPLYLVFLGSILGAGLLSLAVPILFAREVERWQLGAFAALACFLLMVWRRRQTRRRREQLQDLRDSALW
jgi:membrane protein implicated in regulation of membrane protease activity